MLKPSAIALCALVTISSAFTGQAFAYTDDEIAKAKQFIAENFKPDKKAMLEELAKKAGKSPEELFLDISKIGGDSFLGENSAEAEESSDTPAAPPKGAKKDGEDSTKPEESK